jgi:hypothetical protein
MFELLVMLNQTRTDELSQLKQKAIRLMKSGNLKDYFKTLLEVEQMEKQLTSFRMN